MPCLDRLMAPVILVYPVMFLYRQSLELSIKNLIELAWRLLDKEETSDPGSHNLEVLWKMWAPPLSGRAWT
ncbi:hypothetical protein ABIC90_002148 [Variovorax boronicumulans]